MLANLMPRNRARPKTTLVVSCGAFALQVLGGLAAAQEPEGDDASASPEPPATAAPAEDEPSALVVCRLPAGIERRGGQVTHLGQRREVELSREVCEDRGGEVVEDARSRD